MVSSKPPIAGPEQLSICIRPLEHIPTIVHTKSIRQILKNVHRIRPDLIQGHDPRPKPRKEIAPLVLVVEIEAFLLHENAGDFPAIVQKVRRMPDPFLSARSFNQHLQLLELLIEKRPNARIPVLQLNRDPSLALVRIQPKKDVFDARPVIQPLLLRSPLTSV